MDEEPDSEPEAEAEGTSGTESDDVMMVSDQEKDTSSIGEALAGDTVTATLATSASAAIEPLAADHYSYLVEFCRTGHPVMPPPTVSVAFGAGHSSKKHKKHKKHKVAKEHLNGISNGHGHSGAIINGTSPKAGRTEVPVRNNKGGDNRPVNGVGSSHGKTPQRRTKSKGALTQ